MVLGDGFEEFRGRQRRAIGERQRRKLELLASRVHVSSSQAKAGLRCWSSNRPETGPPCLPTAEGQAPPTKHHAPNAMPEHNQSTCVKLLFLAPMQPMGRRLSGLLCPDRGRDWLGARRWRRLPLSLQGGKALRLSDIQPPCNGPATPLRGQGIFKVVTSRTDPRRSSSKPGPAKQSCTPSLILRSP
jgi:hypothetical protein